MVYLRSSGSRLAIVIKINSDYIVHCTLEWEVGSSATFKVPSAIEQQKDARKQVNNNINKLFGRRTRQRQGKESNPGSLNRTQNFWPFFYSAGSYSL